MSEKPPRFQMEQSVSEELSAFVETISEKLEKCGIPEADRAAIEEAGESAVEAVEARLDNVEKHIQIQFDEIVDNERQIDAVEERIEAHERTHEHTETSVQAEAAEQVDELVPMEVVNLLDLDELVNTQRSKETIERATTIFENLPDWGERTPKGRVLRMDDHNVKNLVEAELDTSLEWKQVHRACEVVESFTKGACTYIRRERHGRVLCLHEHSDLYDRIENGSHPLTSSSAHTGGRPSASG